MASQNVMIVDDSAVTRKMVHRTLQMAELNIGDVYEASNGIEALARLGEHEVAVMLVDVNMPDMNGIELVQRMKGSARLCHVPIVIVSTEGSSTRIAELESLGILGFVRKPFHPEQLRDLLVPLLGVKDHAGTESDDADSDLF